MIDTILYYIGSTNMTFTTVMESVLIAVLFVLIALCWLCEKKPNVAVALWNTIVRIRNDLQALFKPFKGMYTTVKNENPVVEEPELADSSGDKACDLPNTSGDQVCDLPNTSSDQVCDLPNTSGDQACDLPNTSSDQVCDLPNTSSSLTADLVLPSFRLYVPSPQRGDNTARIMDVEEAMRCIIRIVNLTTRKAQSVENALNYFKFILFDLHMGEEVYPYIHCHLLDQLDWWHSNGDSELEIVGELFGGLIDQGIRLNIPNYWKMVARKVLSYLENDDIKYLNFAQAAIKKLKKDLPSKYAHLIQEMFDKPRSNRRRKKPTVFFVPPYAYSYKYL